MIFFDNAAVYINFEVDIIYLSNATSAIHLPDDITIITREARDFARSVLVEQQIFAKMKNLAISQHFFHTHEWRNMYSRRRPFDTLLPSWIEYSWLPLEKTKLEKLTIIFGEELYPHPGYIEFHKFDATMPQQVLDHLYTAGEPLVIIRNLLDLDLRVPTHLIQFVKKPSHNLGSQNGSPEVEFRYITRGGRFSSNTWTRKS